MSYESIPLPKPDSLEGTVPDSKILIIASGHSTRKIIPYKEKLRNRFDAIIACNYSFQEFDDFIDYHLVIEKTSKTSTNDVFRVLSEGSFRTDIPRIINWKGIGMYPKQYTYIKTTRSNFDGSPNIKHYMNNGAEGLLIGPLSTQKFALGSILLSSMHLSAMIGANEIYVVGADMCFRDEYDHFYKDKVYREPPAKVKKENAHKIIKVKLDDKEYDTTKYFAESAEYIDSLVATLFKDIRVFDFSGGLLMNPIKLDVDEFFGEK